MNRYVAGIPPLYPVLDGELGRSRWLYVPVLGLSLAAQFALMVQFSTGTGIVLAATADRIGGEPQSREGGGLCGLAALPAGGYFALAVAGAVFAPAPGTTGSAFHTVA